MERRKSERRSVRFPVKVKSGDLIMDGVAYDVSGGGLFCAIDLPTKPGDILDVLIMDEQYRPFAETTMEVRWRGYSKIHTKCGVGLKGWCVAQHS